MRKFDLYTKMGCSFCEKAKELLKSRGQEFNEYLVGTHGNGKEDIEMRITSLGLNTPVKTVPQIFYKSELNEQYIGGYDQLQMKIDSLV